uniref:TATA box-binding protein-associated factor RNA polymerase I subunit B n=1 Tax=Heterorhabditis bacteriophora TaxID=37862 RepID=A0A1I7WIH1_HETBA
MEELQSCNICGSQETTIIDGLMYCVVCSTQITNFRELEADDDVAVSSRSRIRTKKVREELDKSAKEIDYVAMGLETPMARKRRKGDFISSKQTNQKEIFTPAYEALRNDGCPGREHAPFYLRNIGSRLTSFTTMLAKCVSTLRLEADFPDGFPNHCFRYLAVCGVAFVDYEYTEDVEQMFRTLILNKNLDFEKKCAKKNRKILRKTRGTEKLGKSVNAWDLLVGDTLDENLEMSSESEGEIEERGETLSSKSPKLVTVVDTKISKSCLNNAGSIYLDMDALVAILYISSVTFGCKWVLLSDIISFFVRYSSNCRIFIFKEFEYITNVFYLDCCSYIISFELTQINDGTYFGTEIYCAGILTAFGRPKHFSNEWNNDVFFTLETKVLAYVLLALKLMFGLDDVREFKMKSQLQMRMMMWEGYDPKDILQQKRSCFTLSNRRHDTNFYYIRRLVRERGFNACIPHMAVAENVPCYLFFILVF